MRRRRFYFRRDYDTAEAMHDALAHAYATADGKLTDAQAGRFLAASSLADLTSEACDRWHLRLVPGFDRHELERAFVRLRVRLS